MKFFLSSCRSLPKTPRRRFALVLLTLIMGVQLVVLYLAGRFENDALQLAATMIIPLLAPFPILLLARGTCKPAPVSDG